MWNIHYVYVNQIIFFVLELENKYIMVIGNKMSNFKKFPIFPIGTKPIFDQFHSINEKGRFRGLNFIYF